MGNILSARCCLRHWDIVIHIRFDFQNPATSLGSMRTFLNTFFLFTSALALANEANHHWPQWRGPIWNGVSPGGDPPVTWSETENLAWKTPIPGSGWSTPIIWGDRIFIHTAIPLSEKLPVPDVIPSGTPNIRKHPAVASSWKAQRLAVICLDGTNGKMIWEKAVFEGMPHQGHHRKGGFASESPVTDGKHVYSYFGSFGLFCHDYEGRLVWKKEFQAQAMEDALGEGTSPALHGDKLIIVVDHELQSFVVAIDKHTGNEIWKTHRDEVSNWTTPRVYAYEGQDRIVINGSSVCAYDLNTGRFLWKCGGQSLSAIPMPAVGHGLAFAASGWRKDTVHAIRLGQIGDLTGSKSIVWSLDRGAPYVPCPMLWGDELYLLEDSSFFSCVRANDGHRYYLKHRLPDNPNFSASPVGASNRIYLLSESGRTLVLKRGKEPTLLAINELKGRYHASPAIVGNSIYIRSETDLYRFTKKTE